MTKIDCDHLVRSYADWLKTKFTAKDVNGVCEITTPFLDRHNDRLQIYVAKTDRGLRLTDDGYILNDLEMCGCSVETSQRQAILHVMLAGFGVQEKNGELFIEASVENFPRKKHALVQAMIAVNDMFLTAKKTVTSLFFEDVQNFLEELDVRFTPNVGFTGKSGYLHRFDFVIPKSRLRPERLVRAINNPTRETATALLFAWTDTKEVRPANSIAYAFLNDRDRPLKQDVHSAFDHYDVKMIPWSHKDQFKEELAA
jgi:Domain of unknown function DUF1829/Domain of unknown function DUF1828